MTCGREFVEMCHFLSFYILDPSSFRLLQFGSLFSNYALSNPSHTNYHHLKFDNLFYCSKNCKTNKEISKKYKCILIFNLFTAKNNINFRYFIIFYYFLLFHLQLYIYLNINQTKAKHII